MSTLARVSLFLFLCPPFARAQQEVGRLAEFQTIVESPPSVPLDARKDKPKHLKVGDVIITQEGGQARAFFLDNSVVAIGGNAELKINDPSTPTGFRTAIELEKGKIRVLVSEGAPCSVKTPSGEISCHGTDFFVLVDPETRETTTIVVSGVVAVRGVGPAANSEVQVHAYELTRVAVGEPPSSPVVANEATLRQAAGGLDLIGQGVTERLLFARGILDGEVVPVDDRSYPWPRRGPWQTFYPQEEPGTIANPLFGVPGNLEVDF